MKMVIAGGSGQLGTLLVRAFASEEVLLLSRQKSPQTRTVLWDGKTLGPWANEVDGADVVINLAGRSVNCRYTAENVKHMLSSRVDSTRVIGQAIAAAKRPPKLWLQMSTATIYAHTFGSPNDEQSGVIGGHEPDAPKYWSASIQIAQAWERELALAATPNTRRIALRTAMVMTSDPGGIFDVLLGLARKGLGGTTGTGQQFMSWIHGEDFVRAVRFLIEHVDISGPVNLTAPHPLPQREFATQLRKAAKIPIGLPAARWMLEIGAYFMRTDTELVLKSRRVIPGVLMRHGFEFRFPVWKNAVADLVHAI